MPVMPPKSYLEVPQTSLTRPKFPVIDAHNHLRSITGDAQADDLLRRMDAFGIERIIDLDGFLDDRFEACFDRLVGAHPDRFTMFTMVDLTELDAPDYRQRVRDLIRRRRDRGIAGLKFHKTLGLRVRDGAGRYVLPSDERLAPIWETAAELGLPVTIHIGDPVAFFDPVTPENERYVELGEHPDWSFARPELPRFTDLIKAQENLLTANPKVDFIIAHVGSYAENLREVARMLDAHPNMYTDTAERIAELGRQPYSARDFLIKYQDRVLYGTDLVPKAANTGANYRFYETLDEYFPYNDWAEHNQGCWNIYGVALPDEALHKIYRDNAKKLIPGI